MFKKIAYDITLFTSLLRWLSGGIAEGFSEELADVAVCIYGCIIFLPPCFY